MGTETDISLPWPGSELGNRRTEAADPCSAGNVSEFTNRCHGVIRRAFFGRFRGLWMFHSSFVSEFHDICEKKLKIVGGAVKNDTFLR